MILKLVLHIIIQYSIMDDQYYVVVNSPEYCRCTHGGFIRGSTAVVPLNVWSKILAYCMFYEYLDYVIVDNCSHRCIVDVNMSTIVQLCRAFAIRVGMVSTASGFVKAGGGININGILYGSMVLSGSAPMIYAIPPSWTFIDRISDLLCDTDVNECKIPVIEKIWEINNTLICNAKDPPANIIQCGRSGQIPKSKLRPEKTTNK